MPERFAHGYQALEDNTETSYQVGEFYTPGAEGGLLVRRSALGLEWPLPVTVDLGQGSRRGSRSRRDRAEAARRGWRWPPNGGQR